MKKFLAFMIMAMSFALAAKPVVKIGSKTFTESYILAEIISQIIEDTGEAKVERKFGLGGTGITFQALKEGEIDIYPEYTGTITEAVLKNSLIKEPAELKETLEKRFGLTISKSLGFNNTYALAMNQDGFRKYKLTKVSELSDVADLKTAFTHEFIKRDDGLRALEKHYGFTLRHPVAMEHALAYEALKKGKINLMEVYTTDAKIKKYNLQLLEDNQKFFPEYLAVLFMDKDFATNYPASHKALEEKLVGQINEESMVELNSLVELDGMSFHQAASVFLGKEKIQEQGIPLNRIGVLTLEHLKLVFVSLFFSILFGVPLGIVATRSKLLGQVSLVGSGILQTIPSLALLCFLIPFFGIGTKPAYVALFLYGLLPIVRNTYTGITQIDQALDEGADLMGLTKGEKLRMIQLPLASINIMTGIKTSAIINVGTATLAAFIGAGGLGNLIVTGLSLNNTKVILTGAIPAALLASALHLVFEVIDRLIIPKGLRQKS